jgi:hypothetical protein
MSTPASVAHPFDIGSAVQEPQLEHIMTHTNSSGAPAPVIPLSTAVATPIVQVRHRGRYPKNVIPFWKVSAYVWVRRQKQNALQEKIAELEKCLRYCAEWRLNNEDHTNDYLRELSALKDQQRKLEQRIRT